MPQVLPPLPLLDIKDFPYTIQEWFKKIQQIPTTLGTVWTSTSGTSKDFTSIPPWAKKIDIGFVGVSTSGNNGIIIQLGDSGGIESTGYLSGATDGTPVSATSTAGLIVTAGWNGAYDMNGKISLCLQNESTNTWTSQGVVYFNGAGVCCFSGGSKSTSAVLDRIRITTTTGVDTFDAGSVNISYNP